MTWQIHVYGTPSKELTAWCAQHDLPLHAFNWRSEYESAGFAQNAIYLLRPDTYVAFADTSDGPSGLTKFCADKQIRLHMPLVRKFKRESIISEA